MPLYMYITSNGYNFGDILNLSYLNVLIFNTMLLAQYLFGHKRILHQSKVYNSRIQIGYKSFHSVHVLRRIICVGQRSK